MSKAASSLPGKPIPVSSWTQLISALHCSEIVKLRETEGRHRRSPYVFRGMDVANWSLETSLQRLAKKPGTSSRIIERSLIRSFRKYASAGAFDEKSEWYVLSVAQHNGLPTRVLDWTASPLVAAHFACGDAACKNEDGVILCLDCGVVREIYEARMKEKGGLSGVSWVVDTRLLERKFPDLDELDKTHSEGPMMLIWEPPSLDARIANQSGLLSLMNDPEESQNTFLHALCESRPESVLKIVIEAQAKSEIRDMLDQNGISERTIFPGLPGLCAWLKRYYGTAW